MQIVLCYDVTPTGLFYGNPPVSGDNQARQGMPELGTALIWRLAKSGKTVPWRRDLAE